MEDTIRQNIMSRRYGRNRLMMTLSVVAAGLGMFFLAVILGTLLYHGISALSLDVFTMSIPAEGSRGGFSTRSMARPW